MLLHKKRHKELRRRMLLNKSIESQPITIEDIPGFYYDYEKKKYFSSKNRHIVRFSDYLSQKNSILLNNADMIHKETIPNKQNELNSQSMFNMMRYKHSLNRTTLNKDIKISSILRKALINPVSLIELKENVNYERYGIYDGHLFTLIDREIFSSMIIQEIIIDQDVRLRYVKEITIKTKSNKSLTNFMIIEDKIIMTRKFEVFIMNAKSLLNGGQDSIHHLDFKLKIPNHQTIPQTFEWPMIKYNKEDIDSEEVYFVLTYKHLFMLKTKSKVLASTGHTIDLNSNINDACLVKSHYFKGNLFTNLLLDKYNRRVILCEVSGDVHFYDYNFNFIQIIKNTFNKGSFVINAQLDQYNNWLMLYSNLNIFQLDGISSKIDQIRLCKLTNQCELRNNLYLNQNLNFFIYKNESNDIVLINDYDTQNKEEKVLSKFNKAKLYLLYNKDRGEAYTLIK